MSDEKDQLYTLMKAFFEQNVPFAKHTGIELLVIADGHGSAQLPDLKETQNHMGSQHAGALFTLGEAASGAASVSLFADKIAVVRAAIVEANIAYKKSARGVIHAEGKLRRTGDEIMGDFARDGVVNFFVDVVLTNADDVEVATMEVNWRIKSTA
ncbi:MAG: PaaI family thioesterase [Henriciella sp.]